MHGFTYKTGRFHAFVDPILEQFISTSYMHCRVKKTHSAIHLFKVDHLLYSLVYFHINLSGSYFLVRAFIVQIECALFVFMHMNSIR